MDDWCDVGVMLSVSWSLCSTCLVRGLEGEMSDAEGLKVSGGQWGGRIVFMSMFFDGRAGGHPHNTPNFPALPAPM